LRRSIWSLTYTTTLSHGQVANWPRPVVAVNPKEMTRPGPSRSSPITPGVRREHRGWSTVDGDGAGAGQRGVRLGPAVADQVGTLVDPVGLQDALGQVHGRHRQAGCVHPRRGHDLADGIDDLGEAEELEAAEIADQFRRHEPPAVLHGPRPVVHLVLIDHDVIDS